MQYVHVCWTEKDISNFVDLASSTLGEDALSAQKTRYLLNALTGYSALLYDFDDAKNDYNSFIALCKRVWDELAQNSELTDNLVRINFSFVFNNWCLMLNDAYILLAWKKVEIESQISKFYNHEWKWSSKVGITLSPLPNCLVVNWFKNNYHYIHFFIENVS